MLPTASALGWVARRAHGRDLLRELIARDLKLRYRGSALGMAWTLLNPVIELLVLLFIFSVVLPVDIPNYSAFLFTGLLVYNWFSSALMFATGAVVNNRELIKRPGVPFIILPMVTVASTLAHFILALPVLFGLLLASRIDVASVALLLPVVMAVQFVLTLSLAYPLATVHVWFRDTQHFLRVGLQLLFYLTPIFYEASMIPERWQTAYHLNPMVYVIESYRAVLLHGRAPEWEPLLAVVVISGGVLALSLAAFRRASSRFADEL